MMVKDSRWRGTLCGIALCLMPVIASAQNAGLSGVIVDANGGVVPSAAVRLVDQEAGTEISTRSNQRGIYAFPSVKPATYDLDVVASGFAPVTHKDLVLTVDQRAVLDISLSVEGRVEQVEVTGQASLLGTADGSVGTVVDRRLAANLPVRGRSFSALVALVPGVSRIPGRVTSSSGSEFGASGQRDTANSLTVDGVSGQSEMDSGGFGNGAGQRFSSTETGTVNGGLSLDAVQEIRIQTSSFAAEFGRTPGAQISLVTRSGTNRLSGALFEQFRNDALMANDWFANSLNVAKPTLDEHQFGGVIGGPVVRNRSFFFASYEGLRLSQPLFRNVNVPSVEARQQNSPLRSVLEAYPEPSGPTRADLSAQHAEYYTQRHRADTWGIRLDHVLAPGVQLFGRLAWTPSELDDEYPLAPASVLEKNAKNVTGGLTAMLGGRMLLDIRGNYGTSDYGYESSGEPGLRSWFPDGVPSDGWLTVNIRGLASIYDGDASYNIQHQSNIVGSLSYVTGGHQLKAGLDYRRLSPTVASGYSMAVTFQNLAQALVGITTSSVTVNRGLPIHSVFQNFSAYVQDMWKVRPRFSMTYGMRWDVNPSPLFGDGEGPLSAVTFEPVAAMKLSSRQNEPLWNTNYGNLFPRLGISYGLDEDSRTVLSGGVGLFGDLEGNAVGVSAYGPAARFARSNAPLPLSAVDTQGIENANLSPPFSAFMGVVDPNLETPRTAQWNVAVQRSVGARQIVSLTYVGSRGEHLLQTRQYGGGVNPDFPGGILTAIAVGRSRYQSMQVQYRGELFVGLQALASYTLSSSRDTTSSILAGDQADGLAPSERDLRHSGSVAISWLIPDVRSRRLQWLLNGWGLHAIGTARSGYPFTVLSTLSILPGDETLLQRASLVTGAPVIVKDPSAPGGQRFNRDAFVDPSDGRQGNTGRNQFRGFSAYQLDLALQRRIPFGHGTSFRIRIDGFNILNTPVFGLPMNSLGSAQFGVPTSAPVTGLASLYQTGGPRSVALSGRFEF